MAYELPPMQLYDVFHSARHVYLVLEMAMQRDWEVILYAVITGKPPYHDKHLCQLVQLIRKRLPPHHPMSEACRDILKQPLHWQRSGRLSLSQISKHHCMVPPFSGNTYKVHIGKGDIMGKTTAHRKRTGTATYACRLWPGMWAQQSLPTQSCPGTSTSKALLTQSGPGMCSCSALPTQLDAGTCALQIPHPWRCHICPCQKRASSPDQLFISCPMATLHPNALSQLARRPETQHESSPGPQSSGRSAHSQGEVPAPPNNRSLDLM